MRQKLAEIDKNARLLNGNEQKEVIFGPLFFTPCANDWFRQTDGGSASADAIREASSILSIDYWKD